MSSETSALIGILSFLVFLALEGLVLAGATRLALRILKWESPSYRKLAIGGLAQAAAAALTYFFFFISISAR